MDDWDRLLICCTPLCVPRVRIPLSPQNKINMELITINGVIKKTKKNTTNYIGGCQYTNQYCVLILNENDLYNLMNVSIKLKGYTIDTLIIPKKYELSYMKLPNFKFISCQFMPKFKLILV